MKKQGLDILYSIKRMLVNPNNFNLVVGVYLRMSNNIYMNFYEYILCDIELHAG